MARPRNFSSPEEMQILIDKYFDNCEEKQKPVTIAGLAFSLGFVSRTAIWQYEQYIEFSDTIKKARLRIETERSEKLVTGGGNVAGMIFDLKNNFGWKDKTEVDQTVNVKKSADDLSDDELAAIASGSSNKTG